MDIIYTDGGRKGQHVCGMKEYTENDCVARSISIVTGAPYANTWLNLLKITSGQGLKNPDDGVQTEVFYGLLKQFGYGRCLVEHKISLKNFINDFDSPKQSYLVRVEDGKNSHLTAVKRNIIHDTFNCENYMVKEYYYLILNN